MSIDDVIDNEVDRQGRAADRAEKASDRFVTKHELALYAKLALIFHPKARIERILEKCREEFIEQETSDDD